MNNRRIHAQKQQLDDLFDYIKVLRHLHDPQLEAHWAKFLCVRVSGFIETSLRTIYSDYCNDKAHPNIINYVGASFNSRRSQNMNPTAILELAGSFNKRWKEQLEEFLAEDGRKEAVESVITIRNSVAHGGTSSISYVNVINYYLKIVEVIDFVEQQCIGAP